jgi:mannosyltransferase
MSAAIGITAKKQANHLRLRLRQTILALFHNSFAVGIKHAIYTSINPLKRATMLTANRSELHEHPEQTSLPPGKSGISTDSATHYLQQTKIALPLALLIFCTCSLVFAPNHSLWLDETASYYFASLSWSQLLEIIRNGEANMALYYALLKLHLATGLSHPYYIRGLSVVFTLLSIVCLFHFTRIYIGGKVALWIAIFTAFNPFIYSYSWEARSYSLTLLFGSGMLWLFWLSMTENRRIHWVLYGLVAGLGLYSHMFLALLIVSQCCFALSYTALQRNVSHYLPNLAIAACVLMAIATPLLHFFITFGSQASNIDWIKPVDIGYTQFFLKNILRSSSSADQLLPRILSTLILFGCFGIAAIMVIGEYIQGKLGKRGYLILYLGICTLAPVMLAYLLQLLKPMFLDRYLIYVAAPLLILCCWSIAAIPKTHIRYAALCCLCITQAHGIYDNSTAMKYGYDELYSELSASCKPGSSLTFTFSSVATTYYYYQHKYPRLSECFSAVSPAYLDHNNFNQVLEIDQLLKANAPTHQWVIDAHVYGNERSIYNIHDKAYLAEHNYSHGFYRKYPLDLVLIELDEEHPQTTRVNASL